MGFDSMEGPFQEDDLMWNKYGEIEFFLRQLKQTEESQGSPYSEFSEQNVFRYQLSALSGAIYSLREYFNDYLQEPLFEPDSVENEVDGFLDELRTDLVHICKPAGEDSVLSGMVHGILYGASEGQYLISVDELNESIVDPIFDESDRTGEKVPLVVLLDCYIGWIEERLEDISPQPERFGVHASYESWEG